MVSLQEIQTLLGQLSSAEKALVLQWVARDLNGAFAGIESRADVLGGEACVVRTRIPVWLLMQLQRLGASEADLLRDYPTLRAEDLTNAWAFAAAHPKRIETEMALNEAA